MFNLIFLSSIGVSLIVSGICMIRSGLYERHVYLHAGDPEWNIRYPFKLEIFTGVLFFLCGLLVLVGIAFLP